MKVYVLDWAEQSSQTRPKATREAQLLREADRRGSVEVVPGPVGNEKRCSASKCHPQNMDPNTVGGELHEHTKFIRQRRVQINT